MYLTNLIYHFLLSIESPFNFILSIFGLKPWINLSERFLMMTEYNRIKKEYEEALNRKIKQFDQSIDMARRSRNEID